MSSSAAGSHALRSVKVAHTVALTIVEDIVSQDLQPGDRLPAEAAMLERFQVGRASIREGLRLLEAYGVITIRPGHKGGPIVRSPDAVDLARTLSLFFRMVNASYRDLVEARLIIEPVMARLAAERQDAKQMDELRRVMEEESDADLGNYLAGANAFHYTVAGASGNPLLDLLGRSLRVLYSDQLTGKGLFPKEARPEVRRTHKEIGEAILAGEGESAEAMMKEHMADLARLQEEKTPAFMDERVSWEM